MNTRSCSPNLHTESKSATQPELTESLRIVESQAEQTLRKEGHLLPTLMAIGSEGAFFVTSGPLNEVAEKNEFAAIARLICTAHDARQAVLALETWIVKARPGEPLDPNLRPAESPHRKEYIFLMGEARGGEQHHVMLPILRDRRGRFSGFGANRRELHHAAEGRFAHLLPPSPLPEKVRSFAAALFKQRGLVPVKLCMPSSQSTAFSA